MLRNALSVQVFIGQLPFSNSFVCLFLWVSVFACVTYQQRELYTRSSNMCTALNNLTHRLCTWQQYQLIVAFWISADRDDACVRDFLQATEIHPLKRDSVCYRSVCPNQMVSYRICSTIGKSVNRLQFRFNKTSKTLSRTLGTSLANESILCFRNNCSNS